MPVYNVPSCKFTDRALALNHISKKSCYGKCHFIYGSLLKPPRQKESIINTIKECRLIKHDWGWISGLNIVLFTGIEVRTFALFTIYTMPIVSSMLLF